MSAILTNFDLVAVGNQIVALETEARDKLATANQAAQVDHRRRSEQIAALLHSVEENAPESIVDICKRAGIGRSRRFELLKIGRGDKTVEQSRKETAARQKTFKAKKKAESVTTKVTDSKAGAEAGTGNGTDPDESAATMKAAHAANEGNGKASKAKSASKPKPDKSETKSKFKAACDDLLPLMSKHDQAEALKYAKDVIDRSSVPADIMSDAPTDVSKLN
jgi:hypothetical protein